MAQEFFIYLNCVYLILLNVWLAIDKIIGSLLVSQLGIVAVTWSYYLCYTLLFIVAVGIILLQIVLK